MVIQARKLTRIVTFCAVLSACATPLLAENYQRVVEGSSAVYDLLEKLYLEQGLAIPFQVTPAPEEEILHALDRIDPSALSDAGRRAYDEILEIVTPEALFQDEGSFGFNASATVALEAYVRSDPDVDWQYDYGDRQPILDLPIEFWLLDSVYATMAATLKEDHRLVDDPTNYWNLFSAEEGFRQADWYFPFRAFFSVGGPHWHFQFGRDKLRFGNGTTGNLLLSDAADFHDFGLFSASWNRFKFTTVYLYLEPWLTNAEMEAWENGEYGYRVADYHELYKAAFLHRFDMKIWKRINISVTEGILWGTKYPQIRDFNPLMVFHNWFEYERSKGVFELGIEVNPWKYLNLHGGLFIWEFVTGYEEDSGSYPGALGYLAGAEAPIPLGPGYLEAGFEWVRTDPWLYNRYHPLLEWTSRRRIWSYIDPDGFFYYDQPLGYEIGADAIRWTASLGYEIPGIGEGTVSFDRVRKGEMSSDTEYMSGDVYNLVAPTGTVEERYVLHLGLSAEPLEPLGLRSRLRWLPEVAVAVDLYRVWIRNLDHVAGVDAEDWQLAASVKVGL